MPTAVAIDPGFRAALAEHATGTLFIQDADELLVSLTRRVDVRLVAGDHEVPRLADMLGSILNAGVAADDLELGLQLEVGDLAVPNQEAIASLNLPVLGVAGDGAILDRPQVRLALPAGQVLAVEELLEAGLVGARN